MSREKKLQERMRVAMETTDDPLELITAACLGRGYGGILALVRLFRRVDPKKTYTLPVDQITRLLREFGLEFTETQLKTLYEQFDINENGEIDYEELLDAIRPPMSDPRKEIVAMAFNALDKTGDSLVNIEDLRRSFCAAHHPSVVAGEQTEEEVLKRFLARFHDSVGDDGMLTKDEFFDYYTAVSKSIDDDDYFVEMIRSVWDVGL